MFGRSSAPPPSSLPIVGGLTVLILASMAAAIPPSPIVRPAGVECGMLVGHGRISSSLAALVARNEYTYLAIDFTRASFDKDALWRDYFRAISLRQFPLWGWVDVSSDAGMSVAQSVAESLSVAGLFLYGHNADAVAKSMRASRPGLKIIAVSPNGDDADVVDAAPDNAASAKGISILRAASLTSAQIAEQRAKMPGPYLISNVVLAPFDG